MIERFKDAKVGDRVWSYRWGWGKVIKIRPINSTEYPILVEFNVNDRHQVDTYTFSGRDYIQHIHPSLFWDEIAIISPPKPKRMVKKKIEGWVNVHKDGLFGLRIHDNEDKARMCSAITRIATVKVTGEYEVAEIVEE